MVNDARRPEFLYIYKLKFSAKKISKISDQHMYHALKYKLKNVFL